MYSDDRGVLSVVVAVGVLLFVLGSVAAVGLAMGQQSPDGEAVLDAVEQRYDDADSVVTEGTVTVSNATEQATYEVTLAATDDDQARVTVANEERRIVAGHTGAEYWVYDPQTDTTTIVTPGAESEEPTVEVRAGPDADTAAPTSGDLSQAAQALQLRLEDGSWDAMLADQGFDTDEVTAEVVDTQTVDGTQAYVLAVTAPETEDSARLWVDTETSELLRAEATREGWTMTIRMTDTRFDVSAADSTFEPPNADGTDVSPRSVDSLATLTELTSLSVADPGDEWTFETGSVVSAPLTAVTAEYTNGENRIVIAQTAAERLPETIDTAGDTVSIGDRTVTIVERNDRTLALWQSDGLVTSVSGDLSRSELESVIATTTLDDTA